jgi:hypothetical protein
MVLVDAHAVALNAAIPADPAAARQVGLLAALTADAYAATNSHAALVGPADLACGTPGCADDPVVGLLGADSGDAVPACRRHAVDALREPANRIVTAYQPDAALSVFADAGDGGR